MDEPPPDVATLIAGLASDNESAKKYAGFKLQSLLGDAGFADAFVQAEGLAPLRRVLLDSTGNTQAYAFGGLDALLELDVGWEAVDGVVIEQVWAILFSLTCFEMWKLRAKGGADGDGCDRPSRWPSLSRSSTLCGTC